MIAKKSQEEMNRSLRDDRRELEQAQNCILRLDEIIRHLYEDNIEGKISDERFVRMSATYKEEQRTLESRVTELKASIASEQEQSANADSFLSIVRKYTDILELAPEIIREFVEKVYVSQAERVNGYKV